MKKIQTKKVGVAIKESKGYRPSDKPIELVIKKKAVRAVSRSMKLPKSWSEVLKQGLTEEVQSLGAIPHYLRARYGVKKINKKFYAKVKIKEVPVKAVSRSMKLPDGWSVDSQQGLPDGLLEDMKHDRKVNKHLYAKVKVKGMRTKESDFHSSPMDHLK